MEILFFFKLLSWQLHLRKKSTLSAEEAYFLLMLLSLPHRVRCVPPTSQKYTAALQKNWCHTKPFTCVGPLLLLCREWWVTKLHVALLIENEGRIPSPVNGMKLELGEKAGSLLGGLRQPLLQQAPTSRAVLRLTPWTPGSESFKDCKLILENQNFKARTLS